MKSAEDISVSRTSLRENSEKRLRRRRVVGKWRFMAGLGCSKQRETTARQETGQRQNAHHESIDRIKWILSAHTGHDGRGRMPQNRDLSLSLEYGVFN